jgi:putative NADPH-quinone reductase/1,4-dihydroxy-2-naphthoate octaprenyltransferase
MNVLIIYGHPRRDSLSDALGQAYAEGACGAVEEVRTLVLDEIGFNLNVEVPLPRNQNFEEGLLHAQRRIEWADHMVFVYPTWWGTVPALLKGFLDRVLTAGFAFREVKGGTGYEGLLKGKSAHLITTMDTPRWVYRWIYRSPGHNAMRRATLQFCGIWPVRVSAFGPVRYSTEDERQGWLEAVRHEGRKLVDGALTPWDRLRRKTSAWLKAVRLQFYPMTWIAYTVGALGAAWATNTFSTATYWIGYLFLFFLEAATVLSNDLFDYESDRRNEYYSVFTGGSRVLVEQSLSRQDVCQGVWMTLALAGAAAGTLLWTAPASPVSMLALMLSLGVLALGYTVPPLKLSHRGLGEINVGLTHSIGVILCGYVFQGGAWHDAFPWLVSVPFFLAVLPAILLAGIPDYEADRAAGKETLVVKMGPRPSILLALICTTLAMLTGVAWHLLGLAGGVYSALIYLAVPHGALLLWMLFRYWNRYTHPTRIDQLIAVALAYIIWFGAIPLINLL